MENKEYLNIREAADFLGAALITLRRWDKEGKLNAMRKGERGHRFYRRTDLELFKTDLSELALNWAKNAEGTEPEKQFYCQNSAIFQARLASLTEGLKKNPELAELYPMIIAIAGEIGDNSFAHNLGSWPDIAGVFFGYNINKKEIVLADRGLGILSTLKRVRPELKNHKESLAVAFTEIISGRAPESRGNGLKFVRRGIAKNHLEFNFQSGDAVLKIKKDSGDLDIKKNKNFIRGCFAFIKF